MSGLDARWTTVGRSAHRRREPIEVVDLALDDLEPRIVGDRLEVPAPAGAEVVVDDDALHVVACEQHADEVAADEAGAADDDDAAVRIALTAPPPRVAALSHFVAERCSAGCETRRCHTTAHSPSVCGVMRSGYSGGITTTASATRAVLPPSRPTMP